MIHFVNDSFFPKLIISSKRQNLYTILFWFFVGVTSNFCGLAEDFVGVWQGPDKSLCVNRLLSDIVAKFTVNNKSYKTLYDSTSGWYIANYHYMYMEWETIWVIKFDCHWTIDFKCVLLHHRWGIRFCCCPIST